MKYELKHGQALVIAGPQGCGKTALARSIAEEHGTFVEIEAAVLEDKFGLADVMDSEPKTLIIDGFPTTERYMERIKSMITTDTVRVDRKYHVPKMVGAPNLIFCSGEEDLGLLMDGDRRFLVVNPGTSWLERTAGSETGRRYISGFICTCGKIWPGTSPFPPWFPAPSICPHCGTSIVKMEARAVLEIRFTTGRFFKTEHVTYEKGRAL